MLIGVPKELQKGENRVSLIPAYAKKLINFGAKVLIEKMREQVPDFRMPNILMPVLI